MALSVFKSGQHPMLGPLGSRGKGLLHRLPSSLMAKCGVGGSRETALPLCGAWDRAKGSHGAEVHVSGPDLGSQGPGSQVLPGRMAVGS